jgi:nitrite reductase (cytochrome c-552)
MVIIVGCARTPNIELPPIPEHGGIGIQVISATEWFEYYPDVVASYLRNYDNYYHYNYLEIHPYMRVLFHGFGFHQEYNSPRGHVFAMESTDLTGRAGGALGVDGFPDARDATGAPGVYHTINFRIRANCFACKSANYPAVRDYLGVEFYSMTWEELRHTMTQPVSCFNCHGNEPGIPRAVAQYVHDALPDAVGLGVSGGSLSCAQCHIEYHFNPVTFEVILPFFNMADMYPTNVLWNYNNVFLMPDDHPTAPGQPFADYVNPRTGVRQIKVQHPEFETVYGRGALHNSLAPVGMAFSCADCHMPQSENAQGVPYRSHEWMSPFNNPNLIAGTCADCHSDLESEVRAIQARYQTAVHGENGLGPSLAAMMDRLAEAVESGRHSDAVLNEIRDTFRNAQFMWDWVASENSNGAHNSRLIFRTMEYAWDYANQVDALLRRIGH